MKRGDKEKHKTPYLKRKKNTKGFNIIAKAYDKRDGTVKRSLVALEQRKEMPSEQHQTPLSFQSVKERGLRVFCS